MNGLVQERKEANAQGMSSYMKLWESQGAEREADQIGARFAQSEDVMGDMEEAYGADFSNIRIHHDADADARVRSVGRDAVAQGNDIFFGKGIFESPRPEAKALVGHELAHTMQQGEAGAQASSAVTQSAAPGAAQGGKIGSWFKGLFSGKKKNKGSDAESGSQSKWKSGMTQEEVDQEAVELALSWMRDKMEHRDNYQGQLDFLEYAQTPQAIFEPGGSLAQARARSRALQEYFSWMKDEYAEDHRDANGKKPKTKKISRKQAIRHKRHKLEDIIDKDDADIWEGNALFDAVIKERANRG